MADDGKRSEVMCFKATERVALDVMRAASRDDRSPSEWLYLMVRRHLYGHVVREDNFPQQPGVNKVDHEERGA